MISPDSRSHGSAEKEGGGEASLIKPQQFEGPLQNYSPPKKGENS